MLGGVRSTPMVAEELAADIAAWAEHGYGIWVLHTREDGRFIGIAGLQDRPDGRGVALRFALLPAEQGVGYASEAAGAVLRFGHDRGDLRRIVAVAREDNFASRTVLGAIGMVPSGTFWRDGVQMVIFESLRSSA
jgi:RimJ/RimL family protein N-acetyltransferase